MWLSGRSFGPDTISEIQTMVEADPSITRSELSRRVCERLNWRGANQQLYELSCRKALAELERHDHVVLGQVENPFRPKRCRVAGDVAGLPALPDCDLKDLKEVGKIEIVAVSSRYCKVSEIWNALFDTYHYLGSGPLCAA